MASQDLIFRFLAIDAGAGAQFDHLAAKAIGTETAIKRVAAGAVALGAVFAAWSVKEAAGFQTEMRKIQTQAGAASGELARMSKAMLNLSGPTATGPEELAKGLFHLESAGIRGSRAVEAMRVAAEGAKLGGANLEDVTNALNAAISSGIPGIKNMSQAMGYLNATVGEGDMRMQDLANALGTGVLAVVKGFGVTMRDVSAALAVFGDNNIRGAEAGTQLRIAVQSLVKPSKQGADILKAMGLSADELAKSMQTGGLAGAIKLLHDRMQASGVQANQVGQVITDAFGRKSSAALDLLIGQYGRFETKLGKGDQQAKGFASSWNGYTKTFQYAFDRMRASVEVMAVKLGTVLLPAATAVANYITKHVVPALESFGHFLKDNADWLKPLAAVLVGVTGAYLIFSKAIKAAAAAEVLFNLALDVNPVIAIASAIAAAAAAAVYFYKTSETFRHIVQTVFVDLATAAGKWAQFNLLAFKFVLDAFFKFAGAMIHGAADAFGWVPGIGGKLKGAAHAFDDFRSSVDSTLSSLANDAGNLGSLAGNLFASNFMGAANSAWNNSQGFGTKGNSPFRDPGHPGFQAGKALAGGITQGVKSQGPQMSQALADALTGSGSKVGSAVAKAVQKAFDAAKQTAQTISQAYKSIRDQITGGFDLGNLPQQTDLFGTSYVGRADVAARTDVRQLETWARLLGQLRKKGLPGLAIAQLEQAGVSAIPVMQQILHDHEIGSLTRSYQTIGNIAGTEAAIQVRTSDSQQLAQLVTLLSRMPHRLAVEIARELPPHLRQYVEVTDVSKHQGKKVRVH